MRPPSWAAFTAQVILCSAFFLALQKDPEHTGERKHTKKKQPTVMQILGRNVRLEAAEQFPENEPGRIACKRAGGETISAEYGRQENDECTAPEHMARRHSGV